MIASALLLVRSNALHHTVWLSSSNGVVASVYELTSDMTGFISLRDNNEDLNRRNAQLMSEVAMLRQQVELLNERLLSESVVLSDTLRPYDFITASVVKNSVMHPHNYITVNKGSYDGIAPEMGVIDQNGVVGVVEITASHNSRVISLLNPDFRLSCKIKGNDSFGSLVWDGDDPRFALLEELPRHTVWKNGDTVMTSGYSAVFPPGIPVGIIEDGRTSRNENLFSLRIRLLTDFSTLSNVQIVRNNMADELKSLDK